MCSQSVMLSVTYPLIVAGAQENNYKYMADLLAIDGKRSANPIWPDIARF